MRALLLLFLVAACTQNDIECAENELGAGVTCYQGKTRGVANCIGKRGHFVCFTTDHHGAACLRVAWPDELERR